MILDEFRLDGRVAIVTGSSTGLGQGMSIALAEAGADVVGVDYVPSKETASIIEAQGCKYLEIVANLLTIEPIQSILDKTISAFGRVDILINNAGTIRREDAIKFNEKDWDEVMDLNVKTVFFFSQAVARKYIEQGTGGKIINIASMVSWFGGQTVPAYTAAKGGVTQLTKELSNDWIARGVNVNAIAPGYMATNNTQQLRADEQRSAEILDRIPAGRWGLPSDLMGPVVFLASSASDYINGYTVAVDGGWLAR